MFIKSGEEDEELASQSYDYSVHCEAASIAFTVLTKPACRGFILDIGGRPCFASADLSTHLILTTELAEIPIVALAY